ncbi:hypothetical protein J9978_21160 [Chromobacterium violaceum]|uniref:hypothetical protein n=1 Tax=Chromobacterium violaceum TaxID=536 RepID=UPI001B31C953|nr:hypothetical protein [Chromobacterium violaceum]MBP4051989.1 hypothetical protein [Chromobacterium violaceum]
MTDSDQTFTHPLPLADYSTADQTTSHHTPSFRFPKPPSSLAVFLSWHDLLIGIQFAESQNSACAFAIRSALPESSASFSRCALI